MSNMPCVSYSLSNMIINVFKKSNEVFTISTFTGLPKFTSIGNRNRHFRGLEEVGGEEQLALSSHPGLGSSLPGEARLTTRGSCGSNS